MKHIMHLDNGSFNSIKNGTKTIEMRLFDDKRKEMSIGDEITFIKMLEE